MPRTNYNQSGNPDQIDITFDPGDFQPVTPYTEDLKDEHQEAKKTLQELRQREEQVRRKAEQLEQITQKEDAFISGKREVIAQIEAYLDLLDHEAAQSQYIAQECTLTHQRFSHHLKTLRNLHPGSADRSDRDLELDHAIRQMEAAEDDVTEALPLIEQISGKKAGSSPAHHSRLRLPGLRH